MKKVVFLKKFIKYAVCCVPTFLEHIGSFFTLFFFFKKIAYSLFENIKVKQSILTWPWVLLGNGPLQMDAVKQNTLRSKF